MTRNGKYRLLSQVVRFVGPNDEHPCKFMFNAVTITWSAGYQMDRKQRLSALSYELRKANLKTRLMHADMVERNILCNKMSHLSEFGCDQCVAKTTGGHYPVETTFGEPLRDELSWTREVPENGTFLGRKGPSPLKDLPGFSIAQGLSIDPMHQAFMGHVHFLIRKFILSNECHNGKDIKTELLKQINRNYLNISQPKEIQRDPRDYEKTWCANEFKVLLLTCGHKIADILLTMDLPELALLFGRFTFIMRALLQPNEWLEHVEQKYDLQELMKNHLELIQELLGINEMNANSHAMSHLYYWRSMHRLHTLSCEPGEAFFGDNKRKMDVRNKHYGRQIHYNQMTEFLNGHDCRDVFSYSKPVSKRSKDNSILVDDSMKMYR